jgi:hypothetical protein
LFFVLVILVWLGLDARQESRTRTCAGDTQDFIICRGDTLVPIVWLRDAQTARDSIRGFITGEERP